MNKNFIKNRFKLIFTEDKDLENMQLDVLSFNMPSISISTFPVTTRSGLKVIKAGDDIEFGELSVTFRLDDDLTNYMVFLNWIYLLKNPQTGWSKEKVLPATLQIYNPNGKPVRDIHFYNVFPKEISKIDFETNTEDTEYFECTVTLSYDYFLIGGNE